MSIVHELSCDVAAAMLAESEGVPSQFEDGELTDIVLEFHSTLRRLTREARRSSLNSQFFPASDETAADGATGGH